MTTYNVLWKAKKDSQSRHCEEIESSPEWTDSKKSFILGTNLESTKEH